ncbi:hypothetical protein RRG08_001661 [Elysia crispata]|uniref:Uncharacterized protein n=1 Tax=Elysia crispata TaxID=231223 RepID=A0AAE1E000_9GAST|nr:hypothetical protein RRG08_001661 [Elysia crispata]
MKVSCVTNFPPVIRAGALCPPSVNTVALFSRNVRRRPKQKGAAWTSARLRGTDRETCETGRKTDRDLRDWKKTDRKSSETGRKTDRETCETGRKTDRESCETGRKTDRESSETGRKTDRESC